MDESKALGWNDLEAAYCWVSGAAPGINSAFISRRSAQVFLASEQYDSPDELPDDIDDAALCLAVPHQHELDLGRNLVLDNVGEHLPDDHDRVRAFFHKRGAHARFKDLLHQRGALEAWHQHERQAIERALRQWAQENGLRLDP
jgi:hypothetical protein